MIEILIKPSEVIISGHAKSAPKGEDLVCCAVSTLYSSLVCNLLDVNKEKDVEFDGKDGHARVKVRKFNIKSTYAFRFFKISVKHLAKEYEGYIKIEDKTYTEKNKNAKKTTQYVW